MPRYDGVYSSDEDGFNHTAAEKPSIILIHLAHAFYGCDAYEYMPGSLLQMSI